MTNVAQSVTSLATNHRPVLHGEPQVAQEVKVDKLLLLPGTVKQTVNVSVIYGVPMFSLPDAPNDWYLGMQWKPNGYALMVTFAFPAATSPSSPMIRELVPTTPGLWFSETFSDGEPGRMNQMTCIPSTFGEYHFKVEVKDGERLYGVDPKVVVTPIIT